MLNLYSHTPNDVLALLTEKECALPRSADVVVVGGGIVGAASAYYLARSGLRVVLAERDRIASHQSGRNWGFVRTQYRDPAEVPLSVEALCMWPDLARQLGHDTGWRQSGCIFPAGSCEEADRFERWLADVGDLARNSRMLAAGEVRKLLPKLEGAVRGALYTPTDGQAEPVLATTAFSRAAKRLGVEVLEDCGVVEITSAGGAVTGVQTEFGEISAPSVVCASGATAHRLMAKLGFMLPQQVVRSTVALTTPAPQITEACIAGLGLGLRQRSDGSCIIAADGAVDFDFTIGSLRSMKYFFRSYLTHHGIFSINLGRALLCELLRSLNARQPQLALEPRRPWALPNESLVERTLCTLKQLFPSTAHVSVLKSWAGQIDVLPDALPVIDAPPEMKGLVVASGFSGHGFGLAPAVGRAVAALVSVGESPVPLNQFRLNRFRLGDYGRPHAPL